MEIDVSKCEFYSVGFCSIDEVYADYEEYCNKNYNCYYKKLQQIKQENIELETRLDDEMLRITQLATENIKLEKKLENIKEKTIKLRTFDRYQTTDEVNDDLDFILETIESEE